MKAMAIEIPKTNLKTKQTNNIDSKNSKNINFLDLLLKDIKNKKANNIETKEHSSKDEKNDLTKDMQELLKDLLLDKNDKNILNEIPNINTVLGKLNFNQDMVKEVKNIITSNLKQQNILLSKSEINNFKKIDNITDLVKFANKKELNIKKITFQIAKDLKEKPKLINEIKETIQKNIKQQTTISTSEIISTKKEIKNNIKIIDNNLKTNQNDNDKQISIKNILQNKNSINAKIKNNQNKSDKDIKTTKLNNNLKIDDKFNNSTEKITKNNKINTHTIKESPNYQTSKLDSINNHSIKKETPKQIDLNSLLNNKVEEKVEKTISHNPKKESVEINPQINSNVNINEIKAKQVLAKETISHFKNNLDEAIKNYKPPISKVNIELNPKNLGKVEVSIIQRGNNITLNMNSDPNNVLLFQNHQAEFRQALTNIGFSNIDMNFNSNQEKEKRQNQAKKNYKDNGENIETADIKIEAKYQYA